MVSLIVSGHGQLAPGLLSAAEMIFGTNDTIKAVPFKKEEGLEDLKAHFEEALQSFEPNSEVLFLIDLFGGSPYNAAVSLVYGQDNLDVVTGVSLPMVLEALANAPMMSLKELTKHLQAVNQDSFKVFSLEAAKLAQAQEDEEEDEL